MLDTDKKSFQQDAFAVNGCSSSARSLITYVDSCAFSKIIRRGITKFKAYAVTKEHSWPFVGIFVSKKKVSPKPSPFKV